MKDLDFDEYCKWANEPKQLINPERPVILFNNWLLELLSKTEWWKVPLIWIPMMVYQLYLAETSVLISCYCFAFGLFLWTFMEYLLHRFAFHSEDKWLPNNNFCITAHFLMHGIHHAFP